MRAVRFWVKSLLALAVVAGSLLGWGYWHSLQHAHLHISVNDHALRTRSQLYGSPHGVSLVLRDAAKAQLAVAHSVEPLGYILAVHPSTDVGDCRQYERSPSEYATCYGRYSEWLSTWVPRVRAADVGVGICRLRSVPVAVHRSNSDWLLWWVPLRHVGGLPRQYFALSIDLDSRACIPVSLSTEATQ